MNLWKHRFGNTLIQAFYLQFHCVCARAQLCPTRGPMDYGPPDSLPLGLPRQNIGVVVISLSGIFPLRIESLSLTSPALAVGFFTLRLALNVQQKTLGPLNSSELALRIYFHFKRQLCFILFYLGFQEIPCISVKLNSTIKALAVLDSLKALGRKLPCLSWSTVDPSIPQLVAASPASLCLHLHMDFSISFVSLPSVPLMDMSLHLEAIQKIQVKSHFKILKYITRSLFKKKKKITFRDLQGLECEEVVGGKNFNPPTHFIIIIFIGAQLL